MTEHQTKFIAKFPVTSQSKRRSTKQNHCKLPVNRSSLCGPVASHFSKKNDWGPSQIHCKVTSHFSKKTTKHQGNSIAKSPVTSHAAIKRAAGQPKTQPQWWRGGGGEALRRRHIILTEHCQKNMIAILFQLFQLISQQQGACFTFHANRASRVRAPAHKDCFYSAAHSVTNKKLMHVVISCIRENDWAPNQIHCKVSSHISK